MMKKLIVFVLLAAIFMIVPSWGQNGAEGLLKQARENLDKQEYVRARYFFVQASQALMKDGQLEEAVRSGVKASELYRQDKLYAQAFDFLLKMEQHILSALPSDVARVSSLRYPIIKERMRMYIDMKRAPKAFEQLKRLQEVAAASRTDSLGSDLLYTKAICYYTFGMVPEGDKALHTLIAQYKGLDNYNQVKDCYQALIDVGRKANSARMVARAYASFLNWNDSVKTKEADQKYQALQQKYTDLQQTIADKEGALSAKQYFVVALWVVIAILVAALILGAMVLMRFIMLSRKQKTEIATLNEHNIQKTRFIQNISAQMQPALQHLDGQQPAVKAIATYLGHIQDMATLENSLAEPCEMKEVNMSAFCERIMDRIRQSVKPDVSLVVNAPKLSVAINEEYLERLLSHLLCNAAIHTPAGGKITLEFKKRSAHSHQIMVSDTGEGIAEEKREKLFVPFAEPKDLMKGDGLGLPICALIARKMNGTLTLDTGYKKGARFIVELHA